MQEITQEYVQSLFDYRNGNLYWKISLNRSIKIGSKAGTLNNTGYYRIKINGKSYLNHRLIFLYNHNYLPKELDHIDNNKLNNKIENLREVTRSQNQWNRESYKNTSSKYKGVCWNNHSKKWIVQISINSKQKYLGSFSSETKAAKIYNEVAIKYFGKYANLNKICGEIK